MKHHQRRRVGITAYNVMQSHAINIEELADWRIAPTAEKLQRDVCEHNGDEQ